MGIAKVTLNNETLMDITDDTVTASGLMLGDTAHGANGESVTGTYVPVTYDVATETTDGLMSASDKVKLNGVATGAEVNQNAFSNVKVGTTTIAADSKTDTLTLTAGTNITLTPNATSDSVTIAVNGMPSKVSDLDNDSGFITSSGTASNVSGTVAIEHGGTGATSASAARTNLGLGSAATASTSSSVGNNSSLPTGAAIQSYVTGLGYTTNTGTVTSIATGAGLTGGTITGSGTIKADLKSETKSSLTAASKGSTTDREYAVGLDANGDLSVNVPWENTQTVTGVKGSSESSYRTGNVSISASNIGLGNVENKSSATIRGELTKSNVTTALGFTPYTQDEVNALVSSVFTYKGTKSTYAQVSALTGMKTGDVWQVTEDNSEYVYNGSAWEKLGPTIDLSGYLTSVSVAGQSLTPGSNSITAEQLKTALGLGSAAYASTASSVGNNTNLPTGAAVQSYVTGLGYTTNTGTVTKVTAGTGLSGGDITTAGTISLKGQNIYYATCPTAAATAAKVATTTNGDFELTTGAVVIVKFTNGQTYNGAATLNVDGKGAKTIVRVGTTNTTRYFWQGGEAITFVYDGTYFVMTRTGQATTTYFGITQLSSSTSSTSEVLAATPAAVKAAYDLAASKTDNVGTITGVSVNGTSIATSGVADVTVPTKTSDITNDSGFVTSSGVTSIATGTGLTGGPITTTGTISLEGGVVTAGSAGPTAAVTGSEGTTVAIPRITVDEYGRVTGLTSYNLTNKNTTYTAATSAPGNVASSSAVGTSTNYARQDHTHGIALATGDSNGQVKIAGTNIDVKGWNTAATYDVESTLANDSKLPTGAAVKSFVEGKGYITTDTNNRRVFHGTCTTAAATKDKVVTLSDDTGWELLPGTIIGVKFSYSNTYSSSTANPVTLNVNGTGAKNIWYAATHSGAGNTGAQTTMYGYANRVIYYMYDGTYWVWLNAGWSLNSNTIPAAQCETAAATAAKAASLTNHTLTANTYCHFNIRYANTAQSALTMNVDGSGAKPIYINGTASSSSNYTLPAGTYIAFYNGTYWNFRTDGVMPGTNEKAESLQSSIDSINNKMPALLTNTNVTSTATTVSLTAMNNYSLFLIEYVAGTSNDVFLNSILVSLDSLKSPTGFVIQNKGVGDNLIESDSVHIKYTSGTSFSIVTTSGASNRYVRVTGLL